MRTAADRRRSSWRYRRGGVPVAVEVARSLGAEWDVFPVRKLGVPGQPELAMGAIAPGGLHVINADIVQRLGIPEETIDRVAAAEQAELVRRERAYRDGPPAAIAGRTVILVDDGLATGAYHESRGGRGSSAGGGAGDRRGAGRTGRNLPRRWPARPTPSFARPEPAVCRDRVLLRTFPAGRRRRGAGLAEGRRRPDTEDRSVSGARRTRGTGVKLASVHIGAGRASRRGRYVVRTRKLNADEWTNFFDGFSRCFRGRPVTILVRGSDAGTRALARGLPLLGVTTEHHDGEVESIEILTGEPGDPPANASRHGPGAVRRAGGSGEQRGRRGARDPVADGPDHLH